MPALVWLYSAVAIAAAFLFAVSVSYGEPLTQFTSLVVLLISLTEVWDHLDG